MTAHGPAETCSHVKQDLFMIAATMPAIILIVVEHAVLGPFHIIILTALNRPDKKQPRPHPKAEREKYQDPQNPHGLDRILHEPCPSADARRETQRRIRILRAAHNEADVTRQARPKGEPDG